MKKVGVKTLFFTLICSMILAANAFAFNATDHVSIAPNGKGDVLIFPAYFTGSGWESKIIVTNSSLTDSVVAKVIIRSKENSQELRDFLIFLSPSDVWTGTLYTNANGMTHIRSTDDSCLGNNGSFASATNPFDWYLESACAGDTNTIGYVTIIQGASFNVAPNMPGVKKTDIKTAYDNWATTANNPINVLAGQMEIRNSTAGLSYALNATTLKNYDYNIANKMIITFETRLGEFANNTIGEVEAALAKDNLVVPYYANTLGSALSVVTFPSKLSVLANCAVKKTWPNQFAGFPSPMYTLVAYDLQENSVSSPVFVSPQPVIVNSFPGEVNFLSISSVGSAFDEGWLHIDGNDYTTNTVSLSGAAFTYTGLPMIAASMRFDANGNAGWLYNAHTLGTVDLNANGVVDLAEEYNYHFWGQTDN